VQWVLAGGWIVGRGSATPAGEGANRDTKQPHAYAQTVPVLVVLFGCDFACTL
jgi:hypothetical protein